MAQMYSHNGTLIELPTFGCYSGCAADYCYLFGFEVPMIIYFISCVVGIFIGVWIIVFLLTKYRKGGLFGVPQELTH